MKAFIIFSVIILQSAFIFAQERGVYNIISVSGKITDKKSGKPLGIGEQVNLQTELEFGSPEDRAVVMNPSGTQKYRLTLPESVSSNNQLIVSSDQALRSVEHRTLLVTREIKPDFIPVNEMEKYFGSETFSIIGDTLTLNVAPDIKKKYDLVFRFEQGNDVKNVASGNFLIDKKQLNLPKNQSEIHECFIMLNDASDQSVNPVTQVTLSFIDESRLHKEFSALLKATKITKSDTPTTRQVLKQYCADVYGNIDPKSLNKTLSAYFKKK